MTDRPRYNPNAEGIPLDEPEERRIVRRQIIDVDHDISAPGTTEGVPLRGGAW